MAGIFKAYDIRGIYGEDLTPEIAHKIGRAFVDLFAPKSVAIGRDMRPHSQPLFDALAEGITMQGADVLDLGLCTTPMTYFAVGHYQTEAGIMVTASHNSGPWNGLKLCRSAAVPISGSTGIADIESRVKYDEFTPASPTPGTIKSAPIDAEYTKMVKNYANHHYSLNIAADMANGMGIVEARPLHELLKIDAIFDTLDGTFPNHEANPLKHDTYEALQEKMRNGNYDFGVAFDGDADRVGFVDENGNIVPMDIITALIAQDMLAKQSGIVFYDLRSSKAVKETIEAAGGTAKMCRVGHAFIKQQMRDANAIFAGELSGHYYFLNNGVYAESAALAVICIANIVASTGKKLSECVAPIQHYFASGEINSEVEDTGKVIEQIKQTYADGNLFELDGISVEYDDWWFNVRCSNTEPLIRLNLEADTESRMNTKRDEILNLIRTT